MAQSHDHTRRPPGRPPNRPQPAPVQHRPEPMQHQRTAQEPPKPAAEHKAEEHKAAEHQEDRKPAEVSQAPVSPAHPVHRPGPTTKPVKSSGKYRLLAQHVGPAGQLLDAGTEVGTDTGIPWPMQPSNQMEGLDGPGKEAVNKIHHSLYGRDAPWHDEDSPYFAIQRDREAADKQRKEEEKADAVSHQQAFERGEDEFHGDKIVGPPRAPVPVLNKGGDTSMPMGPAAPRQDVEDPAVKVRTAEPLKDQMPKEGGAPSGGTQQPKG